MRFKIPAIRPTLGGLRCRSDSGFNCRHTFTLNSAGFSARIRVRFATVGVQALACLAAGIGSEQAEA
jgi:hypothetical protein